MLPSLRFPIRAGSVAPSTAIPLLTIPENSSDTTNHALLHTPPSTPPVPAGRRGCRPRPQHPGVEWVAPVSKTYQNPIDLSYQTPYIIPCAAPNVQSHPCPDRRGLERTR